MKNLITILLLSYGHVYGQNSGAFTTDHNALDFDGIDDYVNLDNIGSSMAGLNEYTIEFWVKFSFSENSNFETFYAANPSDGTNRFWLRVSEASFDGIDGSIVAGMRIGTSPQYMVGTTYIGDNECHHIAFTYNNGACSLYVDGNLEVAANHTFTIAASDLHSLGQEYDTGIVTSAHYNGLLDDFRIWNKEKSQTEIVNEMHSEMQGSEANLISNFTFNQGTSQGNNVTIQHVENSSVSNGSEDGNLINFSMSGNNSNFLFDPCSEEPPTQNIHEESRVAINFDFNNRVLQVSNLNDLANPNTFVYNMSGQLIHFENSKPVSDLSFLSPGVYLTQIQDSGLIIHTTKIVIAK